MLRIHQCRSAVAAQTYYTQGLAREDYYTEGQEIAGRWGGRGGAALGLSGDVDRAAFVRLSDNLHPTESRRLTLRTRADRTVGYDANFHAPKGVSLLFGLHRDPRIVGAFRDAVAETMSELERDAATRVRKGGRQEDRVTGNLVWAEFVHLTARPTEEARGPDPHLHAHCFVFNATFDEHEQAWKAGQFQQIVRDAPYFEAAFHTRLANWLREIGYRIERTATGWDIAGVPRSVVEKYSSRTREIEEFAAERGVTDPIAKGSLGARTRRAKIKDASLNDLRAAWDRRLTTDERDLMIRIASGGGPPGIGGESPSGDDGPDTRRLAAERALEWAVEHCFERRSSMPLRRLVAEALRAGVGEASVADVWRAAEHAEFLRRDVNGQTLVTTRRVLEEERAILQYAVDGKGVCSPARESLQQLTSGDWTIRDERLATDQRRAVDYVLDSTDRVMAIRGAAGTGKTTMMTEAIAALRASGRSVVVVAPTADAARGEGSLRDKGFIGADTVARLLTDSTMQKGLSNRNGGGVLWVDEAGLLGAGTLRRIFELAESHKARVVLCGDARQHKPVERGDALRVLEEFGGVESVELTTIRRQKGVFRDAVAAISEGDFDTCVERLGALDAFKEIDDQEARTRAAARDYLETLESGRTALVISPTHAEGRQVAAEIRRQQRERGLLKGEDREFTRLRSLDWTAAIKSEPANYSEGLIAHFHQHARGVVAGDKCRVTGVVRNDRGETVVRGVTPRGVAIDLPIADADRFEVYEAEKIRLAVGDRLRITRNGKTADERGRLTNGSLHTVTGFTKHGAIELDGFRSQARPRTRPKIVPVNYGHLAHGSVITSHASQSKDVHRSIICQSAASFGASSVEQLYVSISRGRDSVAIYTDDAAALIESARRSAARYSATELTSPPPEFPREPKPSPDADKSRARQQNLARDIARRQSQNRGQQPVTRAQGNTRSSKRGKDRDDGQEREHER